VSTTLATQVAVLPLLVLSVGQVSLIALVTNILVLVFVPYAMLAGFGAALVASVSTTLAFPLSAVAYALLRYIIEVSVMLGSLPYAAVNL
jgi:competence protein ComEC